MNPRARVVILVLMTIGGILPLSVYFTIPSAHAMVRFSSYSELEHFLLTRSGCSYQYFTGGYSQQLNLYGRAGFGPAGPSPLTAGVSTSTSSVSTVPSHSETNNQVSGVDELDTVKTDGQYIYTVSNNAVDIVAAYPVTNAQLVSRISLANRTIDGIFVEGNKLSMISEASRNPTNTYSSCGTISRPGTMLIQTPGECYCGQSLQMQDTSITVYDITSRFSPRVQTTITVNGTFIGARLIGKYAYLVSSSPAEINQTLPVTSVNGQLVRTQATQVYHSDVSDRAFSYTTVSALDISQTNPTPTMQTFLLGTSSTIYVSLTNIFLTQPIWESQIGTAIHRISISGPSISYQATGTVAGHVLNQYSMDENGNYFRIATSTSGFGQSLVTNVYVLDKKLNTIGRLEGLSPGEIFYAARFMGDRAYLVTYHNTDPLFVVDLHNPSTPTVMGALNVPGYSDFLQPYDQTHLIGIGKIGVHTTVKVSLFNVTDPTRPVEVATYAVPSWYSDSPALRDAKAVLFDKSNNLMVIPIEASQYPNYYNQTSSYGVCSTSSAAYVFNVTATSLTLRGTVTHQTNTTSSSCTSAYYITRSLFIGSVLYTVSSAAVGMNGLTDLSGLGFVILE